MSDLLSSLLSRAGTLGFDNSTSGLVANNVQDAIDELALSGGSQPYTTLTDPALNSITQNMVDTKGGVVITLTGAGNDQTLPTPTDTSIAHEFTVINNDTSTNNINIIGASTVSIDPGRKVKWTYDSSAWVASDAEGIIYDDGTSIKAQTSTRNFDAQTGFVKGDSLKINDTDDSNTLNIVWNENDSVDRILNLKIAGADGTIQVEGVNSVINQDVTTDASTTFAGETLSSTAPSQTMTNTTPEDTDGGRESERIYKGTQSGLEITTLVKEIYSHDGAIDDEKGKFIRYLNDGNDGNSPSKQMMKQSSDGISIIGDPNQNTVFIVRDALGVAIAKIDGEKGITNYGGLVEPPTIINSATYTVLATDFDISVQYTPTGAVTIVIPQALNIIGQKFSIADDGDNASVNNITIQDDAGTPNVIATIASDGDVHLLKYNGTAWRYR